MESPESSPAAGSFAFRFRVGLPARGLGVRHPIIYMPSVEGGILRVEAADKIFEATSFCRRPNHFRQRQRAREGEIFHVLAVPNVFAPDIALRAKDVAALRRAEISGLGIKRVN